MRLTPRSLGPLIALVVLACWAVPHPIAAAESARVVYLVGRLADEDLIALTSAVGVGDPPPVMLFDTPGTAPHLKGFLTAFRPDRVVPVGAFSDSAEERQRRLGVTLAPAREWKDA